MPKEKEIALTVETTKVEDVRKAILYAIKTKLPLMIWGKPGIGKSSLVRDVATELSYNLIDLRLSLLLPEDLMGLPAIINGLTKWMRPELLPPSDSTTPTILFLDEINLAQLSMQHAAYQLILDRRIGAYQLPDSVVIIAAGNRIEDRTGVTDMNPALANRFIHINFPVPTKDEWTEWAVKHNIHPQIIGFINFQSNLLWNINPNSKEKAQPTPRSWEFASKLLWVSNDPNIVSLAVGTPAGQQFVEYIKNFSTIPNVWDIVEGKMRLDEGDVGLWIAVVSELAYQLSQKTFSDKMIDTLLHWLLTINVEYATLLLRQIKVASNPTIIKIIKNPIWANQIVPKWTRFFEG